MKKTKLLSGSVIAVLSHIPVMSHAATCTALSTGFVCGALDSAPISSDANNISVAVDAGASIVSDDEDDTPISLGGDNVAITNNGTITQSDDNNGGNAITTSGNGVTIVNSGAIQSGDRAIETDGGSNVSVTNEAGATIEARRQAVRAGTDTPGASVVNDGTIISTEGRALQLRSFGASVINRGDLIGAEEVVEARGDFFLENHGTIRLIDPSITDEDGVQLSGGEVQNFGFISGSDDGVDLDEGLIVNHAGATILSTAPDTNDNGGIDIDEIYDDGVSPERAPTGVTIVNDGTIEGPNAINTDVAAMSSLTLTNRGVLRGRGGTAINLAPDMGDSILNLEGTSEVFGDVLFGSGDDTVSVTNISSGFLSTGFFDGDLGFDTAAFASTLADFQEFTVSGTQVDLSFLSNGDLISATFLNFESWFVGGTTYTTAAFEEAVNAVPLPASLPLLLAGFGGLGLMRRNAKKRA
ncbi:MAG: VPLPA-CTERM sorting domain-containing protein [Paracoccaceae bacterium]